MEFDMPLKPLNVINRLSIWCQKSKRYFIVADDLIATYVLEYRALSARNGVKGTAPHGKVHTILSSPL